MRLRGVLFDAVGTLLEPAEPVGRTYAREAALRGVALPAWRLDDAFRRILASAPPMAFPDAPAAERRALERSWWRDRVRSVFRAADSTILFEDFDDLFDALFGHYARGDAWRPVPGAHVALRSLRRAGLSVGVASNFDWRLKRILQEFEILELLDSITLPSTCGAAKPEAAFFRAAAADLGPPPAACLYVGDDPELDVAAAGAAGLRALDRAAIGEDLRGLGPRLAALGPDALGPDATATLAAMVDPAGGGDPDHDPRDAPPDAAGGPRHEPRSTGDREPPEGRER